MLRVFLTQYGVFRGYAPVYTQTAVQDADTPVCFRMIEFIALVLEHGCLTQYGKTVSKAFRDEELPVIILRQLYGHVLAVCRRTFAYVNGDIQHFSFYASYQFGLCERRTLEMQPTHHAIR